MASTGAQIIGWSEGPLMACQCLCLFHSRRLPTLLLIRLMMCILLILFRVQLLAPHEHHRQSADSGRQLDGYYFF